MEQRKNKGKFPKFQRGKNRDLPIYRPHWFKGIIGYLLVLFVGWKP
jgi:hypothetical protein